MEIINIHSCLRKQTVWRRLILYRCLVGFSSLK